VSLDAGTVSATAASTAYTITINHTLSAGLYFLAFNTQTAATTNHYSTATTTGGLQMPVGTSVGTTIRAGWQQSVNVTSGFGTAASLSLTGGNTPDVWIRKA
jgi:hypothetical protein